MKKPKFKTGYYARQYKKYKRTYSPIGKGSGKLKDTFMPAQMVGEN